MKAMSCFYLQKKLVRFRAKDEGRRMPSKTGLSLNSSPLPQRLNCFSSAQSVEVKNRIEIIKTSFFMILL